MSAIIEEVNYILTDVVTNHNKYWRGKLFDDATVVTEWGRVGYDGQSKSFPGDGKSGLDKRCREKYAKGYRPTQVLEGAKTVTAQSGGSDKRQLAEIAKSQIQTNNPLVAALIERLAQENVHNITSATTMSYDTSRGTFSTPLGIVTQNAIDDARRLLVTISQFVTQGDIASQQVCRAANEYLMAVPQHIGMKRLDIANFFGGADKIQKQNDILESLEASLQLVLSQPDDTGKKAETPKLFELRLHLVEDGREIDRIRRFYRSTNQSVHACSHLDVKTVYEIEVPSAEEAFKNDGAKLQNIWELWHGTSTANVLSILKSGLKCSPPSTAKIAGKAFGPGIYASDQSTKSLNYAYGYWHGGGRNDRCMMFLLDMAMGKYFVPSRADSSLPKPGYDSTFAKAGQPFMNNEMVAYRNSQVRLTRLVEFTPGGR